ncbi:hypothetical protein [Pedobacter heparinus]|uniref:hypothetical protein n=1 Tax=Pedobacter heparinus TaxID=984 RepID=UPI00292FEB94|nr:hypothetical protein [Pedobacter heparinus]
MKLIRTIFVAVTLLVTQGTASQLLANVRMPKPFGNGMVLQRNKPITVWGWADANEKLTVSFAGKKYSIQVGADQKWTLSTDSFAAVGPYEMVNK